MIGNIFCTRMFILWRYVVLHFFFILCLAFLHILKYTLCFLVSSMQFSICKGSGFLRALTNFSFVRCLVSILLFSESQRDRKNILAKQIESLQKNSIFCVFCRMLCSTIPSCYDQLSEALDNPTANSNVRLLLLQVCSMFSFTVSTVPSRKISITVFFSFSSEDPFFPTRTVYRIYDLQGDQRKFIRDFTLEFFEEVEL